MHQSHIVLAQYAGQYTGILPDMCRVAAATFGEGNMLCPQTPQHGHKAATAAGNKGLTPGLSNGLRHFQRAAFNPPLLQGRKNLQNNRRA